MSDDSNVKIEKGSSVFEDLGISGFVRSMLSRRWLLAVVPVAWLLVSNLMFMVLQPQYSATLELTPTSAISSRSGNALSGLSGNSLLGSVLGGSGGSNDAVFSTYLESWSASWFAARLAANPAMMHRLFAGQDGSSGTPPPAGIFGTIRGVIKGLFGIPIQPWHAPSTDEVMRYLSDHVNVESSRFNVIAKITVHDKDPQLAGLLLSSGHHMITQYLSGVFRQRTQEHVAYLLQKLSKEQVADYREALLRELEQQEALLMLTSSDSEFAAQPLGLQVSNVPVSPSNGTVLLESFLIAVIAYMTLVFFADRLHLPGKIFPSVRDRLRRKPRTLTTQ